VTVETAKSLACAQNARLKLTGRNVDLLIASFP
jgi:hypothetical protein